MPLRSHFIAGASRALGWNGVQQELHGNRDLPACSEFTELTAGCGGGLHASGESQTFETVN